MPLSETAVGGAIALAAAGLLALLGYLIRYREMTMLIAGYHPDDVADESGVARLVGGYTLLVAALTAALGIGMIALALPEPTWGRLWLGYCVAIIVPIPLLSRYAKRRYEVD